MHTGVSITGTFVPTSVSVLNMCCHTLGPSKCAAMPVPLGGTVIVSLASSVVRASLLATGRNAIGDVMDSLVSCVISVTTSPVTGAPASVCAVRLSNGRCGASAVAPVVVGATGVPTLPAVNPPVSTSLIGVMTAVMSTVPVGLVSTPVSRSRSVLSACGSMGKSLCWYRDGGVTALHPKLIC